MELARNEWGSKKISQKSVNVKVSNFNWFFNEEKTFSDFATIMMYQSDEVYDSQLVRVVIKLFWHDKKNAILKYRMIPFVVFAIT